MLKKDLSVKMQVTLTTSKAKRARGIAIDQANASIAP